MNPSVSETGAGKPTGYDYAGLVSDKGATLAAVARRDPGLFPRAFCRIMPFADTERDPKGELCSLLHSDGVGTKVNHLLAMYRHTGDPYYVRSMPTNSLVMNLDDILCVGAVRPGSRILVAASYDLNQHLLKVLAGLYPEATQFQNLLIEGEDEFFEMLRKTGIGIVSDQPRINLIPSGGETASVADTTRTLNLNHTFAVLCMPRKDVIDNGRIQTGDIIVGLSSSGRASWEPFENSGIRSNGLTDARHRLFGAEVRDANPDTFDPRHPNAYSGRFNLDSELPGSTMTIGRALASPTRTFAPLIAQFLNEVDNQLVHGMVHCSGGGATKVLGSIANGQKVVKSNMLPVPLIFQLLKAETGVSEKEMWQIYNMGVGFEVCCQNQATADTLIALARSVGIQAQIIGEVQTGQADRREVVIKDNGFEHSFTKG